MPSSSIDRPRQSPCLLVSSRACFRWFRRLRSHSLSTTCIALAHYWALSDASLRLSSGQQRSSAKSSDKLVCSQQSPVRYCCYRLRWGLKFFTTHVPFPSLGAIGILRYQGPKQCYGQVRTHVRSETFNSYIQRLLNGIVDNKRCTADND